MEQPKVPAPLDRSLVPLVLPEVAVKLLLGGEASRDGETVFVRFDGETLAMHDDDFRVALKAAYRLKLRLGTTTFSTEPSYVIRAMQEAHKFITEDLFGPASVRVLYYPVSAKGSAFYRCILPSFMLNKRGNVRAFVSSQRTAREALDFDVVVLQIDHTPQTIRFAKALKSMGKKVVFEIDDDYESLETWHTGYGRYREEDEREGVREMLTLSDAVTVTTPYLAKRYSKYNRNICVLPNFLPLRDWPKAEPHGTGEFRVVWAGSPSHAGDLLVATEALWSFAEAHQNVRLTFFGLEVQGAPKPLLNRILTIPFVDFEEYPSKLAELKADVAIAPLADVEFNESKSHLKLLEYGGCGYPIIASDTGPYRGVDAAIRCRTPEEWRDALEACYHRDDLRSEMKARAERYARSYDAESAENTGKVEEFFLGLAKSA